MSQQTLQDLATSLSTKAAVQAKCADLTRKRPMAQLVRLALFGIRFSVPSVFLVTVCHSAESCLHIFTSSMFTLQRVLVGTR